MNINGTDTGHTVNDFSAGMNVLYVPNHAFGDTKHKDCQRGIVSSVNAKYVFVRYWRSNGTMGGELAQYGAATDPTNLCIVNSLGEIG